MGQMHTIRRTATTVEGNTDNLVVTYHDTVVVRVVSGPLLTYKTITLDTGGWFTHTTKARMNQASHQYGLGSIRKRVFGMFFIKEGQPPL